MSSIKGLEKLDNPNQTFFRRKERNVLYKKLYTNQYQWKIALQKWSAYDVYSITPLLYTVYNVMAGQFIGKDERCESSLAIYNIIYLFYSTLKGGGRGVQINRGRQKAKPGGGWSYLFIFVALNRLNRLEFRLIIQYGYWHKGKGRYKVDIREVGGEMSA